MSDLENPRARSFMTMGEVEHQRRHNATLEAKLAKAREALEAVDLARSDFCSEEGFFASYLVEKTLKELDND